MTVGGVDLKPTSMSLVEAPGDTVDTADARVSKLVERSGGEVEVKGGTASATIFHPDSHRFSLIYSQN